MYHLIIAVKNILCTVTQSIRSPPTTKCKQCSISQTIFNQPSTLDYWCDQADDNASFNE